MIGISQWMGIPTPANGLMTVPNVFDHERHVLCRFWKRRFFLIQGSLIHAIVCICSCFLLAHSSTNQVIGLNIVIRLSFLFSAFSCFQFLKQPSWITCIYTYIYIYIYNVECVGFLFATSVKFINCFLHRLKPFVLNSRDHLLNTRNYLLNSGNHLLDARNYLLNSGNHLLNTRNYLLISRNYLLISRNGVLHTRNHLLNTRNQLLYK